MFSVRPYLAAFHLELTRSLTYRANFFFGRVREIIVFAALLYLYTSIPHGFRGYTANEMTTYVVGSAFLSAILLVYGMGQMAAEIADGDLTNYLLRPVHYFGFWAARLAASRSLLFFAGVIQIVILLVLFPHISLVIQRDRTTLLITATLLLGSYILIQLMDFLGASFGFWSDRSHGMRWLITVLVQFLSGAYLPVDLLPSWAQTALTATPFPTLIYAPLKAYLGMLHGETLMNTYFIQWTWITIFAITATVLWKRGVKSYEAYGR